MRTPLFRAFLFAAAACFVLVACPGPEPTLDGGVEPVADSGTQPTDAGGTDAGVVDSGTPDAGMDAGSDAGSEDGGMSDGGSFGTGSLTGALAFPVGRVRAVWNHHLVDGGRGLDYLQVGFSSGDMDVCDDMPAQPPPPTEFLLLSIGLPSDAGPNAAITPGTWVIDNGSAPSPSGGVSAMRADIVAGGSFVIHARDATGTITITSADLTHAGGSFDLVFNLDAGMSPLTGTFSAPGCP